MPKLKLQVAADVLRLVSPLRIAGHEFTTWNVILLTLDDGVHQGRGEASGVYFLGDNVDRMLGAIENVRAEIEGGADREALRSILPPGGARNAIDCAMWELEAARSGKPVWQLAGVREPRPLTTTFTLGADRPAEMARAAAGYRHARSIKIKLTGNLALDIERVRAIRAERPDAWLGVDGNQGFSRDQLDTLIPLLVEQRVSLLEQPLARGEEAALKGLGSPIPVAGDESILSLDDVTTAPGRFDVINIKLDKCGGLTEGLLMAAEARRLGLGVMVGTMVGTSIATAPAFVLGQICDFVDLDGPTFIVQDRSPSVSYRDGRIFAGAEVWGSKQP
jgi:L-alanine-DL-glutamate epimerase-like enolase superfamily enzyme